MTSQEGFEMKPRTKKSVENEEKISKAMLPDVQQADQTLSQKESRVNENIIPTKQRDIDDIKKDIQHHWNQAEQSFLEVGRLLIEAKKQVAHGSWLQWLSVSTEISPVKAQRLMRLAEEYASNTSPVTHLGFSKASVLLTLPQDERKSFIEEAHDFDGTMKTVSDMSKRELEKVVHERKKTMSPNMSEEELDSACEADVEDTKNRKTVDWVKQSPLTFLIGIVIDFENIIDDVLGILENQVDNDEERDELVSKLRSICDKALRELPPIKSVEKKLPA